MLVRVRPYLEPLWHWLDADRKAAKDVNRELLDWLSRRPQPERPFFAFLNYFDAHAPYLLPTGNYHRFGGSPTDTRQRQMIEIWDKLDKSRSSRKTWRLPPRPTTNASPTWMSRSAS